MSLPVREQRVLGEMESELRGCEPRLVAMFAIFNRLTRNDGAPLIESLGPADRPGSMSRRRGAKLRRALPGSRATGSPRAIIVIPLVLGLVVLLVALAATNPVWHSCQQGTRLHGGTAAQATSCQPVPGSQGRP